MRNISRRQFLSGSAALVLTPCPARAMWPFSKKNGAAAGLTDIAGKVFENDAPKSLWKWSVEGFHYGKLSGKRVMCGICPNHCLLKPGDRSICRSKVNFDGKLYSLAYGNPCSVHVDPVEKKPLYHFKPGVKVFSIAAAGCNFRCLNCQNWEISQVRPEDVRHYDLFPPRVLEETRTSGSSAIAYTYSEAITFFEYMIDTARLARAHAIDNLWISNGYINHTPLVELCKVIDGANINLKSFSDTIYRKLNGGRLEPVLNTFKTLHTQRVHFEMTHLVVPGYVDNEDMLKRMCDWILTHLGPDYPLHFLRFFPRYKLDRLAPTPISTLIRFRELAMDAGIRYVYLGNVPDHEGNHTYCHQCKKLLIERHGYFLPTNNMVNGRCKFCQTPIPGIWKET
jgi:pyruvate formate lyase activating enzyme